MSVLGGRSFGDSDSGSNRTYVNVSLPESTKCNPQQIAEIMKHSTKLLSSDFDRLIKLSNNDCAVMLEYLKKYYK